MITADIQAQVEHRVAANRGVLYTLHHNTCAVTALLKNTNL